MFDLPYLTKITPYRYVSEVGGYSGSDYLTDKDIGMNPRDLEKVDELQEGVLVVVEVINEDTKPLSYKNVFQVRRLNEFDDGFQRAKGGKIVFSELLQEKEKSKMPVGEELKLNTSVQRLPPDWERRLVERKVSKDLEYLY